jgi:histidyl-tRNA synthetase
MKEKARKNPLRLLDTKDSGLIEAMKEAPKVTAFLEPESKQRFEEIQSFLTEAQVSFSLDESIVRGLDYYTETVFEVHAEGIGAQSALCGGGRYDELIAELGGSPNPSVGVAMGIERTLLAMEMNEIRVPEKKPDLFVVAAPEASAMARERIRQLRKMGFSVQTDIDLKSWKSQLRQADKSGARFALFLGEDELKSGKENLKDLATGEQNTLSAEETESKLRGGQ